jgi:hypothetical protein
MNHFPQHMKDRIFTGICEWPASRLIIVTASGHEAATNKMRTFLADLYECNQEQVSIYSVYSYHEQVSQGMSADEDLRLFETGWQGGKPVAWAADALIVVDHETSAFLRNVHSRIPTSAKNPGFISYRDLLGENYGLDVGSVVGCGLDRLDRTCSADEIDAAIDYYKANETELSALPIGERREQIARFVRGGCRFS